MITNRRYCMSAYLMFRSILDAEYRFSDDSVTHIADGSFPREAIHNSDELLMHLKHDVQKSCADGNTALMLSGGIDSAILASFMPEESQTYTFKCIVPGVDVIDETPRAKVYADRCKLKNEVIEIYWEDFEKYAPILMKHKGAPIHSIEVQIYKAALKAKKDGFTKVIFGENADIIYGGMNGLLAKDWTFGEFVDRYSYVQPYKVLKDPELILEPFKKYVENGRIDAHRFINEYFRIEALGTYQNACETAGVEFVGPFSTSDMAVQIDYNRIRSGDTKYFVREVYRKIYGNDAMPPKIPMPRPMNEWMTNWEGPTRPEFWPHCTEGMTGDQKWMIYALEKYLNILGE